VAEHPLDTVLLAGGTDLLPKLKRRQLAARVLVDVRHLPELAGIRTGPNGAIEVGGGVTLAAAAGDRLLAGTHPGYGAAAGQVSSPALRQAGTTGGNLCVDTRCNYYDMTEEWRRAIGYCLKRDGVQCLVAPGSSRCWASRPLT
ncbi:molybdopterin dehydrogenase FAD-binding protein, partial [mine drainage metagenome]